MKRIALIAHDNKKTEMVQWCKSHREVLLGFELCGTGTTAGRVSKEANLVVEGMLSGPLGGDQQIGARIAQGEIAAVIFLCDPLCAQPHDPDVKALLRIAVLYDVPIATNISTANCIIAELRNHTQNN